MPIYAKQNSVSWRIGDGDIAADEYIYTGELSEHMAWDGAAMRPMSPEEIARAAIQPVTRKQMLIALHRVGLLDPIKSAVAASGDIELQIAFDEALTFERGDSFLAAMQAAMGETDADVDAIFALAAGI